jgi:hypothetical protein
LGVVSANLAAFESNHFGAKVRYHIANDLGDSHEDGIYFNSFGGEVSYEDFDYQLGAGTTFSWIVVDREIVANSDGRSFENRSSYLFAAYSYPKLFGIDKLNSRFDGSLIVPTNREDKRVGLLMLGALKASLFYQVVDTEIYFTNELIFPSTENQAYQGLNAISVHKLRFQQPGYLDSAFSPFVFVDIQKKYSDYRQDPGDGSPILSHSLAAQVGFSYQLSDYLTYDISLRGQKNFYHIGPSFDDFSVSHTLFGEYGNFGLALNYGYKSRLVADQINYDYWFLDNNQKYVELAVSYKF